MDAINLPEVLDEVTTLVEQYEDALVNNRLDVLDDLFWRSPLTVRYGATEQLYGIDEIRRFRMARPATGLARAIVKTQITTFGRDCAVAHREFSRGTRRGRQTQTWIRTDQGWKIVSAHVSSLDTSNTQTG